MESQIMDLGWWLVASVAVAVLGVGRVARLVTHDSFPPSEWARQKWTNLTKNHSSWTLLAYCFWCATPWIMLVAIGWFLLGLSLPWAAWSWWLFWGWMALSYLASMIVARDEPPTGD